MKFKEAVSLRIFQLCEMYNYTPNGLAEASAIPPSTLQGVMECKINNPSSYLIFKICKTLHISIKEFFDCELFKSENLID